MSIRVALFHQSLYDYSSPVRLTPQLIRLRPTAHCRSLISSYGLRIEPQEHFLNWIQDPLGNWVARVVFPEPVTRFAFTVDLLVDMTIQNPFDFFLEERAERWPFTYTAQELRELKPWMQQRAAGPRLHEHLRTIPRTAQATADFLVAINRDLAHRIRYLIRMEPGVQTPEQTLAIGSGSCRDSAWLLVQILRHLGFAARFVSGYLIQLKPDVAALDGPSGTDHDFTDLHAWTEVYLPGAGWIGLDPTSGLLAAEGHLPLFTAPDPAGAAPVSGGYSQIGNEAPQVEFQHRMRIDRVYESARVTLPYDDRQWAQIDALGMAVDRRLMAADVRLTMGGEPTFVAIDHPQEPEWNIAAVGPTKEPLAEVLLDRLRRRLAPDGLVTHGQGKWYPGESLPRWARGLHWRSDGAPLLHAPLTKRSTAADAPAAASLVRGVARRLGVDPANALPAYEDPYHFLHRERQLPINVDALDNRLDNAEERARLTQVFTAGLGRPRGYVLPVQRWQSRAWVSERWRLRGDALLLAPGDSPIGYRLPLDSLPWLPPAERPTLWPTDPFAPTPPLPARVAPRLQPYLQSGVDAPDPRISQHLDEDAADAEGLEVPVDLPVRTALAIEPRDGALAVFMPPLARLEDYLDLLAAVEDSGAELDVPVRIEGYPPPEDARLTLLKVTPDPGVIEVNVQPAADWPSLRDHTEALYEDARQARLGTEKYLIDGRAVGTGGGNHFVLGGATPADSPFLRRPDLLASLLRHWQRHPALSYFFSGLFIGPTSQAPRVDEARDDQLYELEIALTRLTPGREAPPWRIDRALRHLLADLSGNTHRTEICIDKLYSPDGPTGRLGLVEFRGFEMPPHARMSLVQQLLLRALVARFWEQPSTEPLLRWGPALRDRFLLPHFLLGDLRTVLDELRAAGFAFDDAWFDPHFEFRFPRYGSVVFDDVEIELRQALEPWHVLGEEGAVGGTARYVDASLERLQIRVNGLDPGRYCVGVHGLRLPLAPTGRGGEYVAGLRFRAWQPARALHPEIGVHAPLVFDLYDLHNGRAVAGCTYHVAHPAGRNYEDYPVNAYEAEARRLARFETHGHSPGPTAAPRAVHDPENALTLDLRRWL